MRTKRLPFVSIIITIRNEADYIEHCLNAVLAQNYPSDRMEIIMADGMSTDGTREIIQSLPAKHPNLFIIDNLERIVPTGLNKAIKSARGEFIIHMSAHCEYPDDYVRRMVSLKEETSADNVGGVLVAKESANYTQESIRVAYCSPLSVGGALRSYESKKFIRKTDTVHGGCWSKATLISAGLFDKTMVRNQDDELNFRLREKGGRIVQDSTIRVKYYVRDSFFKLFNQFMQYGFWKVPVIRKHFKQANLRHFVPAAFILALIVLTFLAPFYLYPRWGLGFLLTGYIVTIAIGALIVAARRKLKLWPGIFWALAIMHIGYGSGFIMGISRWVLGPLPADSIFEQITR